MKKSNTFGDLKKLVSCCLSDYWGQLKERLNLEPNSVAIFADQALRKRIMGVDSQLLTALGLKHGDIIHIGNTDVTMTAV